MQHVAEILIDQPSIKKELVRRSTLSAEALAAEAERACPHCGQAMMPVIQEYPHPIRAGVISRFITWPERHGCSAETEALKIQARQLSRWNEQQRAHDWARRLKAAGLVGWLKEATFDSFVERDNWPDALTTKGRVATYAYNLLRGDLGDREPWLILHGSYGTGKTHLAAAVVHQAIEVGWYGCYFRVWTDYLRRLQATWDRNKYADDDSETEADIIAELQQGKLVVIDDIDKRPPGKWSREVLFTVINYRYNEGLPTILTFNYGPEDVADGAKGQLALVHYLGEATLDRLIERAYDVVEFAAPSYRSGVNWQAA